MGGGGWVLFVMNLGTIIITRNGVQLMELGSVILRAFRSIYKYLSSQQELPQIQYNMIQNKITKKRWKENKNQYGWGFLVEKKPEGYSVLTG